MTPQKAVQKAVEQAGGAVALARKLQEYSEEYEDYESPSHQAICQWEKAKCPPRHVIPLERITGVNRHELRPDLYPDE